MPKHYAKKGKTKHDPIFDQLTEINKQDATENKGVQSTDATARKSTDSRRTGSNTEI